MEDITPFNNITRNSTTVPMVSPIPFETTSDQYYFSPISNQLQGTSPDMYWQYNDHCRSPYPNGFNNVGQYQYWRHSPYPTGDQNMLMREWSTSSPDPCSYQIPPWSMEAVSMVQGMNMHQMNHGISQWPTGSARTSLDFSGSGDTSISDMVIPPEFPRDEHMSLEQENRNCNSFNASPWQQSNCTPLMTELLGEPKYSSCRWQTDVMPLCDTETKELEIKCIKTEPKKSLEMDECCEKKMDEKNAKPQAIEARDNSKSNKDKSVSEKTLRKRHTKSNRKPEAYDRQKKVQRQREGLIRKAIQTLNLILPDDNTGKKLSKNLVLLKAIDHIEKLKEQLGDIPVTGIENIAEAKDATKESPQRKSKKRKRSSSNKVRKNEGKDVQATPEKISFKHHKVTSPELPPSSSSFSPPKLTHLPLPPKTTPPRAPTTPLSQSATNNNRGSNKDSPLLELLQDPAILTPSDTSSGSERAESPTTDDDGLQDEGEITSHVKRPMNAFLLFSKSNRENFKKMFPGKDNRRISTILGEHWNTMKAEEKQPFQEVARELMRKTKETYPDFKYSPTDQSPRIKVKSFRSISKEDSPKKGIRVGHHRLRSRHGKERNSDSNVSSNGSCSGKEKDMQEKASASTTLADKHISKNEFKQQPIIKSQVEKCRQERLEKADKDFRYSRCDNWVQCDKCKKWRMLDDNVDLDDLPDKCFRLSCLDGVKEVNGILYQINPGRRYRKTDFHNEGIFMRVFAQNKNKPKFVID